MALVIPLSSPLPAVDPVSQNQAAIIKRLSSTDQKIHRIALNVFMIFFSLVAAAGAILTFTATLVSSIGIPIAILATLMAVSLQKRKRELIDYEDPEKLRSYREEALHMNFFNLYQKHQGMENLIHHNILSKLALHQKFKAAMRELPFSDLAKVVVNLEELTRYQIISQKDADQFSYLQQESIKKTSYLSGNPEREDVLEDLRSTEMNLQDLGDAWAALLDSLRLPEEVSC